MVCTPAYRIQPRGQAPGHSPRPLVKDELEEYYESEIHHGRLYPNLDTLVDKGLVDKGELDQRTNVYTVTRRGEREIAARREWENQYIDLEE
ncbi:PadR family transcriptional regulator [Halobacterium noricense]|nr:MULTISPECIES: helix-turn-helix transcriptional regulator [Halobacterium]MCG1004754.1 PadR family transcriptional regulator [Halobacterium noricense]